MHNTVILHTYIPWLAAVLASALQLELVHRARRLAWGVHPIPARLGWLLLIALGMACAAGLSYSLLELAGLVHIPARAYELPWLVCLVYLTVVAERERRAARAVGVDLVKDPED